MSRPTFVLAQVLALLLIALIIVAGSREAPTPPRPKVDTVSHTETPTTHPALSGAPDWRAVAANAGPAVVVVRAGSEGQGSGAVIDRSGLIVTAAHVVRRDDGSVPKDLYVDYADGTSADAVLLGRSDAHDIALLKVDTPSGDITPLQVDARLPPLGEPVAAMGAPFARAESISTGIVSGVDRSVESLQRSFQMNGAIQTDAAVNRGNSGGPLLDADGHLRGIVVQIESQTGVSSGVGFAVPAATVKALLPVLVRGDHHAGYLGVTTSDLDVQVAKQLGMTPGGALVQAVADNSPASEAGLRMGSGSLTSYGRQLSHGGGAIMSVDGTPIVDSADLAERISLLTPTTHITLTVRHEDNHETTHEVTLGERPTATDRSTPTSERTPPPEERDSPGP